MMKSTLVVLQLLLYTHPHLWCVCLNLPQGTYRPSSLPIKNLPTLPTVFRTVATNQASQPNNNSQTPLTSILRNEWIGDGHLQFTFELLNGIFMNSLDMKTGSLESIAFSPFSIQSVLMMMHLGSKGITKSEIAKVLHLESAENNVTFSKSHDAFGQAVKSLLEDPSVGKSLHSANQIFVQENLQISNSYRLALLHYHQSSIVPVNFAKESLQVLTLINEWIEKQTQHLISNFLTKPPSPMTTLMAVNAIRYKGEWQYRFDSTDTEKNAWFRMINGHTAKVEMMVAQLPVAYAYNAPLQTSVIELPYKSSRLSMFILLPDDTFGLFSLLGSLNSTVFANFILSMRKVNNLHYSADKLSPAGVNIRLPKFTINSMPEVTQILKTQLGMKSLFSNENANLKAMFSRPQKPVHMDELLHKAILKVDEQGSVAAAVSTSSIERVGTFNGPYFEADHPFVYLLMDKQTGLALFAGYYAGPNSDRPLDRSTNQMHINEQTNNNGNSVQEQLGKLGQPYGLHSNSDHKRDSTNYQ